MLHFRNGPRPRNYLARHEQVRLFLLVMFLLAVVWIAVEARNPQHYEWIWTWGRVGGSEDQIDTRFRPSNSVADDTFVFPAPGPSRGATPAISGPLTEADLAAVRDDEPFRAGEQGAWFKLLDRLRKTDTARLGEESIGPVTFIQLYRQPKEYRGVLVSLAGTVRRLEPIVAPRNDLKIESYYRAWLAPRDNPTNPVVIYTLTVPEGFPEGMEIAEQVELDAFFFKRWPYAARDSVRSAPVVLAKSLRWVVSAPEKSATPMSPAAIVAVAAALAAGVGVFVWWQTGRRRREALIPDLFPALADSANSGAENHPRLLADSDREAKRR